MKKNKTRLLKEKILITKILERQNQSENTISEEIKMLANKQIILTNSQKVDKKEKINSQNQCNESNKKNASK